MRNLKNLNVTTVMALSLILTTGVSSLNSVSESGIINTAFAAEVLKSDVKVKVTTKGGTLNLRKQPSNGAVVASLENGTELITIQDAGPSWVKVEVLEGKHTGMEGWVSLNYIDNGKYTETVGTDINGEVYKYVTTEKDNLNVRKLADGNSEKIGELTRGAKIRVYGETPQWYKVRITVKGQAVYGWANKTYLTDSNPNKGGSNGGSNNSTEQLVPIKTMYVNTKDDNLNVRSSKSASSTKIGELTKGAKINIYKEEDGWYKVTVNGKYGWAKASFFSPTPPSSSNTSNTNTSNTNTSNTNTSNTNTTNQINGYTITSMKGRVQITRDICPKTEPGSTKSITNIKFRKNLIYQVEKKAKKGSDIYYYVKALASNSKGWVHTQFANDVTASTNVASSQKTVVVANNTYLYQNSSCTGDTVYNSFVTPDTKLNVIGDYNTSVKVSYSKKNIANKTVTRTGFINKGNLKFSSKGLARNMQAPRELIKNELQEMVYSLSETGCDKNVKATPIGKPQLVDINVAMDENEPLYMQQYVVDMNVDGSNGEPMTFRFGAEDFETLSNIMSGEKITVYYDEDEEIEDSLPKFILQTLTESEEIEYSKSDRQKEIEVLMQMAKDYVEIARQNGHELNDFTEEEIKSMFK